MNINDYIKVLEDLNLMSIIVKVNYNEETTFIPKYMTNTMIDEIVIKIFGLEGYSNLDSKKFVDNDIPPELKSKFYANLHEALINDRTEFVHKVIPRDNVDSVTSKIIIKKVTINHETYLIALIMLLQYSDILLEYNEHHDQFTPLLSSSFDFIDNVPTPMIVYGADGEMIVHNKRTNDFLGDKSGSNQLDLFSFVNQIQPCGNAPRKRFSNLFKKVLEEGSGVYEWSLPEGSPLTTVQVKYEKVVNTTGDIVVFGFLQNGIESEAHKEIYETFERVAYIDYLTGVNNRRYMEDNIANNEIDENIVIFILDIDDFKLVNDTYGHVCGDIVLQNFAKTIKDKLGDGDTLVRYGGEEFAIYNYNQTEEQVEELSEKVRKVIEDMVTEYDGNKVKVTVSIGAAIVDEIIDYNDTVALADSALYYAKNTGKNKYHIIKA